MIETMMNTKDSILESKNWVFLHFQTEWKHTFGSYRSAIQHSKWWIKAYKAYNKWFFFYLWSRLWLLFGAIHKYVKYLYKNTACETIISAWVELISFSLKTFWITHYLEMRNKCIQYVVLRLGSLSNQKSHWASDFYKRSRG